MITISFNKDTLDIAANSSLQQALNSYAEQKPEIQLANIALVVNQRIMPKSQWPNYLCQNQDQIEIFSPVAGG
ncbi:sulfur carrier protein ThiS [Paraglaciecola aquimarina]|uniref:Sulfur carrier protein ThiS n=1 Tax=Paraglaciecola algarum TaxID=3050085 RepID=A0ABS9D881_9ALTE|nr:sulfur carrier protein ThiS [Paraglaciecola sp. G1-23]MCF2949153.1 sulfur carrier protein ThiS [Paraglaciecola sp. G1-23]